MINEHIDLVFFLLILTFFHIGNCQIGTDCKTDVDCVRNQYCQLGYCQCNIGYVKNIRHCYKLKKYNQQCFYSIQCIDHRMSCRVDPNDEYQLSRCLCDDFHTWNSTLEECDQLENIREIAFSMGKKIDREEKIEVHAKKIFFVLAIAGLVIVCILMSFITICLICGCCFRDRNKGTSEEDKAQLKEVAVVGLPAEGTYSPIGTDFSASADFSF